MDPAFLSDIRALEALIAAGAGNITKELFIPATEGCVQSGIRAANNNYAAVRGDANLDEPLLNLTMKVPDNFVSFTKLEVVWLAGTAAGNMYWRIWAYWAALGEVHNVSTEDTNKGVSGNRGNNLVNVDEHATPLVLANLALGDYIGFQFYRYGADALDTLNVVCDIWGLLFTYIAKK